VTAAVQTENIAPAAPRQRFAFGLRAILAWRNLAHDKIRFLVTLVGIVFSVTLMAVQSGLLLGFVVTIAKIVDRTEADIWVVGRGVRSVDLPTAMPERRRFQVMSVAGVAEAQPYIHNFSMLKRPDGGAESVVVVGFDLESGIGKPWSVVEGRVEDLALPDAVIVDRFYKPKLGVTHLGQVLEINEKRVRVVGFTEGIRTFTQSPHVFADIKTARHLSNLGETRQNYVLVRVAPGHDPATVRDAIRAKIPEVDAYTKAEFAKRSYLYWLITTGAGFSLIIAAALGLIVGIVVTAQTLYATTMDRLPEYATMRAMGAPASYLYGIILRQAAIAAAGGFGLGISIALFLVRGSQEGSAVILMPWELAAILGGATFVMCALAALISIRRVMKIDPVSVFK
jgi:putative ABC transport system permease protein